MEEMLEEPSAEDGDGALRELALGPPHAVLHHAQLLQRTPLPVLEPVVDVPEPGPDAAPPPRAPTSASLPCEAMATRRHRNWREMVHNAS